MKEEENVTYATADGQTFTDRVAYEDHERRLGHLKTFRVWYDVDLNESGQLRKKGLVLVNVRRGHGDMCEAYCQEAFGPRIAFIMGMRHSSSVTRRWVIDPILTDGFSELPIIARIEDGSVPRLWEGSDL